MRYMNVYEGKGSSLQTTTTPRSIPTEDVERRRLDAFHTLDS